ncbi:MAG: hypothetical protein MR436_04005 [Eubacterium sp.]|nr:hypothetical protein [Eubacterium sp.]
MLGWIVAAVALIFALIIFVKYKHKSEVQVQHNVNRHETALNRANARPVNIPISSRNETGTMIYFADNRHNLADREYKFNYKKVNGAWRAYIVKMPSLNGKDGNIIPTHRLWDENHQPYICWQGTVTTLKDMQNISRVWANSIQEYIATGTRFGPE